MNNLLLYMSTVLIWGTTWFAIKLQIGHGAPPEVSIFYRFALASILLYGWCKYNRYSLTKFTLIDHFYFFFLGLSMCSIHHIFIYSAAEFVASGVIAVVFSTVSFFNIIYNMIFYREVPRLNVALGIMLGIGGLALFFAPDFMDINVQKKTLNGVLLAGMGSMVFAFGSMITKRNHEHNISTSTAITMASVYGMGIMGIYILLRGIPFYVPQSPVYWTSVFYLTVFGSVIAFLCYLQLVRNVGANMAGYSTILFPPVALFISSLFEAYKWEWLHLAGMSLVLVGNFFVVWHRRPAA